MSDHSEDAAIRAVLAEYFRPLTTVRPEVLEMARTITRLRAELAACRAVQVTELVPRRHALALCSLGLLGLITSDQPEPVIYADGNAGIAWTGRQLGTRRFQSPFTGKWVDTAPGTSWSSRHPLVLGYLEDLDVAGATRK